VCVLEFTYGDIINHFDVVLDTIRSALDGTGNEIDPSSLPGITVVHQDAAANQADIEIAADAWLAGDAARAQSLHSANQLRVAGWRLQRRIAGDGG
jgi:hypothetical protein